MIDVKILDGNLYIYNMLIVEEKSNAALMDRICSMLNYDMNNYQRRILLKAIEEVKIIMNITESA
ncbi:MAG: hypothetical protein E6Z31_12235 [Clostridium perfringens]|nr:hypothetical protein [Clostridium perfringens]